MRTDLPSRRNSRPVPPHSSFNPTLAQRLVLLLAIGAAVVLGMGQLTTPTAIPASAPATEFSAERAMQHLRIIAREPHPIGSPANAAIRQYLIGQLRILGLEPEVQTATYAGRFPEAVTFNAGTVNNVVARLLGTANTGAFVLNAHYDGADTGPAASDNGAAVAGVLEAVRALRAGPALKNDVIIVFSDGEEYGDLGAGAFTTQHPWAKDVRVAVNTSQQNGAMLREFAEAVLDSVGSSFLFELVRAIPSLRAGTDLHDYLNIGSAGFAFLYTGNTTAYHTALDNVEIIDQGSVQHHGSYALSLACHFGNLDLANLPAEGDAVFFNPLPGVFAWYSQAWALPLAGLIAVLLVALLVVGFRRSLLTPGGVAVGTLAFPFAVLGAMLIAMLSWWSVKTLNSDYQVSLVGNYQSGLLLTGLIALTVAVVAVFYTLLLGWMRLANLTVGALLIWAVLMVITSVSAPGLSYFFTWPLLAGVLLLGWTFLARGSFRNPWWQVALLGITAVPGITLLGSEMYWMVGLMHRFEFAIPLPLFAVPMHFVALVLGLLIPHLALLVGNAPQQAPPAQRWLVPGGAALVSILVIVVANATSGFSAEHPRPDHIAYELNADTGEATWVSTDRHLDAWTKQFFGDSAECRQFETVMRPKSWTPG
jgi:hypothetical protein